MGARTPARPGNARRALLWLLCFSQGVILEVGYLGWELGSLGALRQEAVGQAPQEVLETEHGRGASPTLTFSPVMLSISDSSPKVNSLCIALGSEVMVNLKCFPFCTNSISPLTSLPFWIRSSGSPGGKHLRLETADERSHSQGRQEKL